MIRPVHINDTQELLEMYNYYVINTTVNFDIEPLSLKTFSDKLNLITADYPFIVYEEDNEILGYAYGSRFRPRAAYNYVAESTVYVKHTSHGKQIGSKLYAELISRIKYYRELLEPWKNPRYYIVDQKHKLQEWNSFYKKLESEYAHIIDIKRELYTSYEKILNVRTGWRKGRSEEAPTTSVSVNEDNSQP